MAATHTSQSTNGNGDVVKRPCLFACTDQKYLTSVTTSTFPNLHTFIRGPEFCLVIRKLNSSCRTSKHLTLEERYPKLCHLLSNFPNICDGVPLDDSLGHMGYLPTGEKRATLFTIFTDPEHKTNHKKAAKLAEIVHKYSKENLLLANVYIKDPAVTMIKRDQKIPIIWFVANIGGILGLCMGCSLITVFEVGHHVLLFLLRTGKTLVLTLRSTLANKHNPGTRQ